MYIYSPCPIPFYIYLSLFTGRLYWHLRASNPCCPPLPEPHRPHTTLAQIVIMRRWFDDTENVVEDGNADTSADAAFFLNLPATRICIFRGLLKVEDEGDENETVK